MIKWIFFDIDDTLIDFKSAQKKAILLFYERHREDFTLPFNQLYAKWFDIEQACFDAYLAGHFSFDGQRKERFKQVYTLNGHILTDQQAWTLFCEYEELYRASWCLFDDVLPVLQTLKSLGYSMGIISNGIRAQQTLKLKNTGIAEYFKVIVTSSDGTAKPDRAIFESAAQLANTNIKNCMYVGDNYEIDFLAAKNAGMHSFFINRPETNLLSFLNTL